jgi:hypothetical protein
MNDTTKPIDVTQDMKQQAQRMLFMAKSKLHKAQTETRAHDSLGQAEWHPLGPQLELLEQKAFIEFEQLLGIINGTAHSNYGGRVTLTQWERLQEKFTG